MKAFDFCPFCGSKMILSSEEGFGGINDCPMFKCLRIDFFKEGTVAHQLLSGESGIF